MGDFLILPLIGTTSGAGAATIKADHAVNGVLYGVIEDKGTFDNGVDLTLSVVNSELAITLLTLTNADTDQAQYYPRTASCGATGTANVDTNIMLPVVGVLQVVVAQGGATKTGGLYAIILQ